MTNSTSNNNNPSKKQVAVIGSPIQHSKSPLIHNHFIQQLNINAHYTSLLVTDNDHLQQVLTMIRQSNWIGINVTIPYKEAVMPFLDHIEPNASIIGACNTIVNKNGHLIGYNTDAEGFFYPLNNQNLQSVMVLGNGGSSKAVLYQCCVNGIKNITLVARNHQKSTNICQALLDKFGITINQVSFDDIESTPNKIKSYDLIVNCTSIGLLKQDPVFSFISSISNHQIYYDLIYNPWETDMLSICKANGATVINGAPMLAHQGALAFNLFFNQLANTEIMISLLKQDTIHA